LKEEGGKVMCSKVKT